MRDNEPMLLTSVFTKTESLSQIQLTSSIVTELTRCIVKLLPFPLNQNCKVANFRQGVLVVEVSSASWLNRLKYEQSYLISELRRLKVPSLSSIQYHINPKLSTISKQDDIPINEKVNKFNKLSLNSGILLTKLSQKAPDKLKKQLIKLANHAK